MACALSTVIRVAQSKHGEFAADTLSQLGMARQAANDGRRQSRWQELAGLPKMGPTALVSCASSDQLDEIRIAR